MNQPHEHTVPSSIPSPATLLTGHSPSASPSASPSPRVEMYTAPHRALRYMLSNLLVAMGRATFADPAEALAVASELSLVLWACDGHIVHEERHLRPLLTARTPNATSTLDDEHREHAQQVAELRAIAGALRDAATIEARVAVGHTLYLHFSVFVAETLAHMAYEERVVQPLLDRLCSTEELHAVETAILASIAPLDMIVWLRAMVPASDRRTRAELLAKVRAGAPPDVFTSLLNDLRPLLRAEDRADLAERLGL